MGEKNLYGYEQYVRESKECLVQPLVFQQKESVETTAGYVYKFFQDNPESDYAAFFESLRDFSRTPGDVKSKTAYILMEEIFEYSGLIPPVRARLCQKIIDISFGGVGTGVAAKILGISERVVINVKKWYANENLKSLYDDFADKYLHGDPKSVDELIKALIRYRKDFNAAYVAKVAASYPDESTATKDRKKLVKKKQKRIRALKKGVFNWDDEIDFEEVFKTSEYIEEEPKRKIDFYSDEDDDFNEYDRRLESQVITPPAWYVEEVWGNFKLPGIHLPPEMWARYLSIYEKKRIGKARSFPRTSHSTPPNNT
ncbi:MAG: hypothetical protein ACI4NP_02590 [Thermoguttaceae bacterium]